MKRRGFLLLSLLCTLGGGLYWAAVPDQITATDKIYIAKLLKRQNVPQPSISAAKMTYSQQIHFIALVQKAVLATTPNLSQGIADYHTREVKDLYILRYGSCFDRSRVIEKILRYYGFKTLHVAIYSTVQTHSKLLSLLTPQAPSHALSEVQTKRGWLALDSNKAWLSLTTQYRPIDMASIQRRAARFHWLTQSTNHQSPNDMLRHGFTYVYGLYSRTGKFYPPYPAPFPNSNWTEFLYNFVK